MRLVNLDGRAAVWLPSGEMVDIGTASGGQFGPEMRLVLNEWQSFQQWSAGFDFSKIAASPAGELGPPVPEPSQIFAIGLNYVDHADESGLDLPKSPVVFTKFSSSLNGPSGEIALPDGDIDWEAELVVVIGEVAREVSEEEAIRYIAGMMPGQDISDRRLQFSGVSPQQFSLAKSYANFAPTGPALVTLDEIGDYDGLGIECRVNGKVVQKARTNQMIFSISELICKLSKVVTLRPGDLIFTGTPSGVGMGMKPPRYLRKGDVLETSIEGLGMMTHTFI